MSAEALRPNETAVTGQPGAGAGPAEVGQVMGQLMADLAATSVMLLTLVGVRTGLWESLAAGPASPGELAARSSAAEPCVREWLRSQAAAGYVRYEPAAGRYSLPPAVAAVMAAAPLRGLVEGTGMQAAAQWAEVARYAEGFRTGSGIGWDEHGQLAGLVAPAGADPVLDDRARAAYKARLTELDQDIDDATVSNDPERAARAAAERDALIGELSHALGLGGRSRRLGDDTERARKAVTARIHHAIGHLQHQHPELAVHLRAAIRTGTACTYQPAEPIDWNR